MRSGLVESTHEWTAVAVDADGDILHSWGDVDRPLYYRSAIKSLQATAVLEAGVDLPPDQLAVASASHSAQPVHVAAVQEILAAVRLDESALRCPPDDPLGASARRRHIARGGGKERILHNCSGKHAAFLAASVVSGWPPATYLEADHPLQRRVMDLVGEVTGVDPRPIGVDGCGAPTMRGSVRGLALAFARLSVASRFACVREAVMRYPALTSGNDRPDGRLAMWWGGPAKGGAQGLMVAGRNGVAIATKSAGGSITVAVAGLIEVASRLGLLPPAALDALADDHHPVVLGGGRPVGRLEPDVAKMDPELDTGRG